jgi:predicted nucleic acid-binding protein
LAGCFFDSSALAKLYHAEVGTPEVDGIVQDPSSRIRISRLSVVELPSVFAIKVRTQFISREDASAFLRQFREDIVARKFEVAGVHELAFSEAERLLEQHAFDRRLRALDAIQLAVALGLKGAGLADCFVAADKILCEVAALEGFAVLNPEHP